MHASYLLHKITKIHNFLRGFGYLRYFLLGGASKVHRGLLNGGSDGFTPGLAAGLGAHLELRYAT